MLQAGCGIYRPALTEGPDGVFKRRFILPPSPDPGSASCNDADLSQGDVWTMGVDCCGLLVDWEVAVSLLGPKVRLVWASDKDPDVKKYALEKYKMNIWYDDIFRSPSSTPVPRCRIYSAGFPCQPFSSAGQGLGLDDPRGSMSFGCRDYIDSQRPDVFILEK